ncbi:MAG: CcoQ/FixQ family Cbb3-type cytochrome c oxidase assembly chaperone [Cellvibrionales bacterium]|nr:MAG: CcoQ/FixQ family Cbb3-type cytochrome c oxidase assembly chaperone [Cellvibrionales bacterium]
MDQGTLEGIGTLLAMLAFGAVCVWAYSGRNKAGFDEAAQLPFLDELPAANKRLIADGDEAGETAIETSTKKEGNGI